MSLAGSRQLLSKPKFSCNDCGKQGSDGMICCLPAFTSHDSVGGLSCLYSRRDTSRCYYSKDATVNSMQLHGFYDASAYAGVVYTRVQDRSGNIHISLVVSKTKVFPIKHLTVPRLELCGAQLLAKLLHHTKTVLNIPTQRVYAWTDSIIVLNWLIGNPRRFNTFVGNRASNVVQLIPPDR